MSNFAVLTKNNTENFFTNISTGSLFKYSEESFLWEDVEKIALAQGKKVQKISPDSNIYSIIGSFSGIILYDIKKESINIENDEIIRLKGETNRCYQRIEDLEIQLGIRGTERLEKCEFCKKSIYQYQSRCYSLSGGIAHVECNLENQIKELKSIITKKEDLVKHWSNEANKIGEENHSLIVENRELNQELAIIKLKKSEIEEINEKLESLSKNLENKIEKITISNKTLVKENLKLELINNEYKENLLIAVELFKRVKRILGIDEDSVFYPIPQINISGEYREIIKSSFISVYYDVKKIIEKISKTINEEN